jgi:hypothetical protein
MANLKKLPKPLKGLSFRNDHKQRAMCRAIVLSFEQARKIAHIQS